jgi:hypothetical protein
MAPGATRWSSSRPASPPRRVRASEGRRSGRSARCAPRARAPAPPAPLRPFPLALRRPSRRPGRWRLASPVAPRLPRGGARELPGRRRRRARSAPPARCEARPGAARWRGRRAGRSPGRWPARRRRCVPGPPSPSPPWPDPAAPPSGIPPASRRCRRAPARGGWVAADGAERAPAGVGAGRSAPGAAPRSACAGQRTAARSAGDRRARVPWFAFKQGSCPDTGTLGGAGRTVLPPGRPSGFRHGPGGARGRAALRTRSLPPGLPLARALRRSVRTTLPTGRTRWGWHDSPME